jgi:hypothetical protein
VSHEVPYSARVRELFAALPGGGAPATSNGAAVVGEAMALDRGAWVRFDACVAERRFQECAFRAWGCPHTLAAAAWTAQALRGRLLDDAAAIDAARLARELDAPAEKMGRLLVVEDAIRSLFEHARRVK